MPGQPMAAQRSAASAAKKAMARKRQATARQASTRSAVGAGMRCMRFWRSVFMAVTRQAGPNGAPPDQVKGQSLMAAITSSAVLLKLSTSATVLASTMSNLASSRSSSSERR